MPNNGAAPRRGRGLSETNTVIARRIAEHHAFEAIFRSMAPG